MRSKLFVPASRPELFAKALQGSADALSFDLEDSVREDRKAAARQALAALFDALPTQPDAPRPVLIVRVNAVDSPHFEADLLAAVRPGVALINVPKPESVEAVHEAAERVGRAARDSGAGEVGLLLNIESPRALRRAAELAAAHPSVQGLQVGLGDLFEPLGIARTDVAAVRQILLSVRLAAGEAGVWAMDGAYADIRDVDGYRAEARIARDLGYVGKTCIHPSQVALANETFAPTRDEIERSLAIIESLATAQEAGAGAWVVDGRMIDRPFVERARAIVAAATHLGLIP